MTKPPVRRRPQTHPAPKVRTTSPAVPVALALGLGGVVAGLVWVAGADDRARKLDEIRREGDEIRRDAEERRAKHYTGEERVQMARESDAWLDRMKDPD